MKKEKLDLILILIWPIIATILILLFKVNYLTATILYFVVPSVYLSIRARQYILKALIFALVFALPFGIVVDYISYITDAWAVSTMFSFRVFNVMSVEDFLWGISLVYLIVFFYEYFLDKHITKKLFNKNLKYLLIIGLILFTTFVTVMIAKPAYLHIPYFYLIFGLILITLPIVLVLFRFPKLISKFLKAAAFFFYISFAHEITALKLGHWSFPGTEFIGWISIFNVRFPIEEVIFWMALFAISVLCYFEFFDDDRK
jgi:hypothetical protein